MMERTKQLVGAEGLQIPLPMMAQYGLQPGSEVTVEWDADVIRIVPRQPTQDEIEGSALRLLLKALGDAALVKAQQIEGTEENDNRRAWRVWVYARGVDDPLGHIDYAQDGRLLSDINEALRQIRQEASRLAQSL